MPHRYNKCPGCDGQIQATVIIDHYHLLVNGQWREYDSDERETRLYCENDCGAIVKPENVPDWPEKELP